MNDQPSIPQTLLAALRELIAQGRQRALRAVDMVQVQTCWEIGRYIVEYEQGSEHRACGCFIRPSRCVTHCVTN